MPTPALKVTNLRKVYRRGTVAVDDLSLTVEEGDFYGFLGPNGAGKSTTIHCITGIAEPSGGTIEIFGVDAVKQYREARRLVGLCTQEFNVDPFATPRQIVDWMGGYFGMGYAQRKARIDYLIERFELGPHQKKAFRELSGGLKRRVVLARALINDPKLLILDEPTAGVDVELRRILWRYLQEINGDGPHHPAHLALPGRGGAALPRHRHRQQGPHRAPGHQGRDRRRAGRAGRSLSRRHRQRRRPCGRPMIKNAPPLKANMGINWIGLATIVRREISRMMRVPIQAFIAPWISALLFIFIFGYVVGGRMPAIGG